MKLLKAFRIFKKTTHYSRPGCYRFEAAYDCPKTGSREFCPIDRLPEGVSEFIIDVYELHGPIGDRESNWIHSFNARWDGVTLTCKAIGS